jgi:hypothetical protein
MSAKVVLFGLLLVVSIGVGIALGEWFYRLYLSAIPPVGQSQFNAQASHVAYILYGVCVGLVMFVWSLIGMGVGGLMRKKPEAQVAASH